MPTGGRRQTAVVLMLGLLGMPGCGEERSPDVAAETSPTQTPISTYQPPELDRTELEAKMAKLSLGDKELVDHYLEARGKDRLGEGTWIAAAPMTVDEAVARLLGPNPRLATDAEKHAPMDADMSAYAFLQVGDGVVAWENTGFADPPKRLLAALSQGGAVSAVATDNIEGMTRFGYARDGEIVFDAFEYAFVDDLNEIPAEVRDLAALAWVDPVGPMVETADWSGIALAMSEKVTGVRATPAVQDVEDLYVVQLPWGVMEDY